MEEQSRSTKLAPALKDLREEAEDEGVAEEDPGDEAAEVVEAAAAAEDHKAGADAAAVRVSDRFCPELSCCHLLPD